MATEKRKDSRKRVLKEGEYERANGTYEYRWRDNKGKRQYVYAKTLEELRDKENDVLKDILNGKRTVDKSMTVNDLYDRWEQLKRGLKDNTFENYCYMYKQFVKNSFGMTRVYALKKSDVRAFYITLHDVRHLTVNTIDNIHTVLHQVLELAVEDDYLQNNPSDNALKELKKAYNKDTKKRKALTVPQQKVFEEFLKRPEEARWQPVFMVMLYTGMRVGEITGLQWEDIDLKEGFITVNKTLVYYARGDEKAKGGRNRYSTYKMNTTKTVAGFRMIPILPVVREMLELEKKTQEMLDIRCEAEVDGFHNFIFVNRFGHLQHQGTLNKALRRIIRDCNCIQIDKKGETLPPFSCHTLRHTFVTRLCEADVNIKAIQAIVGHKDISTTLDIYADATRELKKKGANTLEAYFKSIFGDYTPPDLSDLSIGSYDDTESGDDDFDEEE